MAGISTGLSFASLSITTFGLSLSLSSIFSLSAGVSALFLTFINPSSRSAKAEKISVKNEIIYHKALDISIFLEGCKTTEAILENLRQLTEEHEKILQKMEKYTNQ